MITQDEANKYRRASEQFERDHPDYMSGKKASKVTSSDNVDGGACPERKYFGCCSMNSWHQHANYWGLSSHKELTAWLALSPSTVESGLMKIIPGSHNWGRTEHKDTFDKNNLLTRGQVMNKAFDKSRAVNVLVQLDEISLHHVNIAHASSPNRSNDRGVLALPYVTLRRMLGKVLVCLIVLLW